MQKIEVIGLRELLRASVTLSAKAFQDMTASMAANGSRPGCPASISALADASVAGAPWR